MLFSDHHSKTVRDGYFSHPRFHAMVVSLYFGYTRKLLECTNIYLVRAPEEQSFIVIEVEHLSFICPIVFQCTMLTHAELLYKYNLETKP